MPNEITLTISTDGLSALAVMALAPKSQSVLDELLSRNCEGKLSAEETQELDLLLKQIDELNLVKARAVAALHGIKTEQ